MRTNIEIDDALMQRVMASGDYPTKRAAVEAGLRVLATQRKRHRDFKALRGTGWDGDLDAERRDIADAPRPAPVARPARPRKAAA